VVCHASVQTETELIIHGQSTNTEEPEVETIAEDETATYIDQELNYRQLQEMRQLSAFFNPAALSNLQSQLGQPRDP
jgi:hypothetical protein